MKANGLSNWAVAVSAAMVLGIEAIGQTAATPSAPVQTVPVQRTIVVSLEDRKLAVVEDGQVKKVYTVAVGKPGGNVHDSTAREESGLSARGQSDSAGAGESGGDAVDGAERQGLRNPRDE
jgi:hypothetical protein